MKNIFILMIVALVAVGCKKTPSSINCKAELSPAGVSLLDAYIAEIYASRKPSASHHAAVRRDEAISSRNVLEKCMSLRKDGY